MIDTTPFVNSLDNRPVAVFGLARSGLSVIRTLRMAGVTVFAWDDNESARVKADDLGAIICDLTPAVLESCACLVLAPGVPLHFPAPHPVVSAAQKAGVEILCDIEIFHRCRPAHIKLVGITGTNGKSTTTALLTHVLNESGVQAVMGGNIGELVLDMPITAKTKVVVLELSSYQLDLVPTFHADIGIFLNVTPDHLDRHGTMENYIAAKERLFDGSGTAIIAADDEHTRSVIERLLQRGEREIVSISMYDDLGDVAGATALRGLHNNQNMAAALSAARVLGVDSASVLAAFKTYPGLPHRQLLVRTINGVGYVNDSKATNAEAASKALSSYNNIYWIVGGVAKEGGLDGLESLMTEVRHSFLIGESSANFAKWLGQYDLPFTLCETLEGAVAAAHEMAQANVGQPRGNGVVLLSPACASFDQFKSYEERGDIFTALVEVL